MIAVIDYDTGNLCSVANALGRLGAEYRITASPDEIRGADRVLLPLGRPTSLPMPPYFARQAG